MRRWQALAALALAIACPAQAASIPAWLAEASARPAPPGSSRASAVILHDEQIVEVRPKGSVLLTTRLAVRIAAAEAKDAASVTAGYLRGASQVQSLNAWTLDPRGDAVRVWNRKDAADVSDVEAWQLYTEYRHLALADDDIQPGQTFGFETVTEEQNSPFAQWSWWFRSPYPSARSRFEIRLPPGLEVAVRAAHLDSALQRHEGGAWSWEMRDQPASSREPLAPARPDLEPCLRVQALGPGGARSPAGLAFRDWGAVANWLADLTASQAVVTPELSARAEALTSGVSDTLARIQTMAAFVQRLNYVSMDAHISRGWGYRPHDAGTVLRTGYGDCKDKANLLCALLRAAGHPAWLMPVYWGGRDRIDSAWVSPTQFNHCITAILAPTTYHGPAIDIPRHGRVLAFDPTDPLTLFGDLPAQQQGSWALLVHAGAGGLVRLPLQPPGASRIERHIEAELDPRGALHATLVERRFGQSARAERDLRRSASERDYRHGIETRLAAQGGSVELRSWAATEDDSGQYRLKVEYDSPSFARAVGGKVLAFRSALVSPRDPWTPADTARTMPIALPGECVVETLVVHLPEGFVLDERPDDLRTSSDLGRLDAAWSERDRSLVMIRRWELRAATVGPERWADVRALYGALRASSAATSVLMRR